MLRLLVLFVLLALPAKAEEVVAGLSQNRISITTNFDGSEILVFGAVKREARIPEAPPLEVVVTVAGPSVPVTVRKKDRRFGIWVNTDALEVDRAPVFYAVATTGPLDTVVSEFSDARHRISVERAILARDEQEIEGAKSDFTEALIRIRKSEGLYQTNIGAVDLSEQTLFRTRIALPANLTEGDYRTRIFLFRGGEVIDVYATTIDVRKVGLERFLYTLAHERPLAYGILSLAIAIAAGWGASAMFRYLRA